MAANTLSNLLIVAQADQALTPAQRKFNQLVRKIEQARSELLVWQEQVPLFAQAYQQRVGPLQAALSARRRAVAEKVDALLDQPRWSKAERRTMTMLVCDVVADLIEDEATDEADMAALKALHDKHAEVDFDTENRAAMAEMKEMVEAMSGVDLGEGEFESEDELMQRAHERLRADAQAREQAADAAPPKRRKAPTAAHASARPRRRRPRNRCARSTASSPAPCTPTAPPTKPTAPPAPRRCSASTAPTRRTTCWRCLRCNWRSSRSMRSTSPRPPPSARGAPGALGFWFGSKASPRRRPPAAGAACSCTMGAGEAICGCWS